MREWDCLATIRSDFARCSHISASPMRNPTVWIEETAISTEWQERLEDCGRRQSNAVAFFGGRAPNGDRELIFLNGESRHEIPVNGALLSGTIRQLSQAIIAPLLNA